MKRMFLSLFLLSALLCLTAISFAQGGAQVSIQADRMAFRAAGDNFRNLVALESNGQLETTRLFTADFTLVSELFIDSIQDAPRFELMVNVPSLTTGFEQLDTRVLSKDYMNFGEVPSIEFRLMSFATGRVFRLENEKRIEASGRGELMLGDKIDTVSIEMGIRLLTGNEITKLRLPGNLVHYDGTIYFRLSDFGIEVPKENRLMVSDQVQLKFDIFASTDFVLPASSSMGNSAVEGDMAAGESTGGQ